MNELRLGRYQDVLADVEVDHVISDPPYSARTHTAQRADAGTDGAVRSALGYAAWTDEDVCAFAGHWGRRTRGWIVVFTDHTLAPSFASALAKKENGGRYVFAPLPIVETGSRVRLAGDGPSSWTCWIVVARPRCMPYSKWGTLPGAYIVPREAKPISGGKPLLAMRDIVRDYSREGDIVCDPCAGAGTTLLAARMEGRSYIGAEADPATHALATRRLAHMPTVPGQPALFGDP